MGIILDKRLHILGCPHLKSKRKIPNNYLHFVSSYIYIQAIDPDKIHTVQIITEAHLSLWYENLV